MITAPTETDRLLNDEPRRTNPRSYHRMISVTPLENAAEMVDRNIEMPSGGTGLVLGRGDDHRVAAGTERRAAPR
ncbi:hypothetical protein F5X71_18305 [Nocardia brasiliensis]|uniref:Uncharacterized protein n=1 Tax=Nocardia brasiliensis TaxID=37326 RepID=A0A6G9XSY5_NOCBR|nr:hypothetical protein [Nocardia brasiliensis]QIS04018.1 hypothetical protein F5X71_18305 [Nocardia brasiliensis]